LDGERYKEGDTRKGERERKWKKAACILVVEEGERGEW
jgi:hypothetical protein